MIVDPAIVVDEFEGLDGSWVSPPPELVARVPEIKQRGRKLQVLCAGDIDETVADDAVPSCECLKWDLRKFQKDMESECLYAMLMSKIDRCNAAAIRRNSKEAATKWNSKEAATRWNRKESPRRSSKSTSDSGLTWRPCPHRITDWTATQPGHAFLRRLRVDFPMRTCQSWVQRAARSVR